MAKTALITGVTGQDGAYLARLLLEKGYIVHGVKRRASSFNTARIDPLYVDPHVDDARFFLHYGDLTDSTNLIRIVQETRPDEIYNLGAQSHVQVSFETPEYTANSDAVVQEVPQSETTPFYPRSPYGAAKLYAYWITVNYREAYGIHASNGILFNHESPMRGETFVTRKITRAAARIKHGLEDRLYLGNLDAKRDWGHARDFVEGMWRIVQRDAPDDYVLGTGVTHSVRDFVEKAFGHAGIDIAWQGSGAGETGTDSATGKTIIEIDPRYFRPAEVDLLIADPSKAKKELGWEATTDFDTLVKEMMDHDLAEAAKAVQ